MLMVLKIAPVHDILLNIPIAPVISPVAAIVVVDVKPLPVIDPFVVVMFPFVVGMLPPVVVMLSTTCIVPDDEIELA